MTSRTLPCFLAYTWQSPLRCIAASRQAARGKLRCHHLIFPHSRRSSIARRWRRCLQRFHIAKELPMTVLRQRMTEDMQVRNLSPHTQASYLQQVSLFARHFGKSPSALGPEHIRKYQVYLTNEKRLAPGSIHLAVAALRFIYKVTLKA